MKSVFIFLTIGLLACAGTREVDSEEPYTLYLGMPSFNLSQERDLVVGAQSNLSPDSVDKIIGEIYGFRVPTEIGNGGFIIATPGVPYAMSAKDSMLFANAQKFSVHVNIAFPKMTLQQAAELEARLKKLLPEALEINLDLGQNVEVPVDQFYWTPNTEQGLKLKVDSTDVVIWQ